MPTLSPQTTPYYGGGQVLNPANVKKTSGAPSTKLTEDHLGTLAIDNAAAVGYLLVSKSGGVDTWAQLEASGGGGVFSSLTVTGPTTLTGTTHINITGAAATQIGTGGTGVVQIGNATGNTAITGSLSTTTTLTGGTGITATTGNISSSAGAVNAATSMTATLGNITATNGNVVLGTAGNKLVIATGSNASVGLSGSMSGSPGAITVATTACSATAKVFYCRATTGGTMGNVSITAQDGTGFTLTSTGNETSTFNWWIINA